MKPLEVDETLLSLLTPVERTEIEMLLAADGEVWEPQPGPQTMAYESQADVVGFGGAAGGGKTALAVGLALTRHQRVAIFRPIGTELVGIIDEIAKVLGGSRDGFNGKDNIWRVKRRDGMPVTIELGAFQHMGDEQKFRGRPHDLLVYDEAAEMRESQVRFVMGWLRTTDVGQRCRVLMNFNPPSSVEGRWIVSYFGPWIDTKHPHAAKPGELRWFAVDVKGKDIEVEDNRPFVWRESADGEHERVYEFEAKDYKATDIIRPLSRTFVPSKVTDNRYLMGTNYVTQLQSMPEPRRSQLLKGDFAAGMEDDPWQVIPTEWVEIAMARWSRPAKLPVMDSVGVDVAAGGKDNTVIARRHGMWFDVPLAYPGTATPDGPTCAAYVMAAMRDRAVIHIDLFGVGAKPYGFLMQAQQQVIGVNVGDPAPGLDLTGRLTFKNLRSMLWWRMRESLDPSNNTGICLPPDKRLLADLCAPTWQPVGRTIAVASRDEIVERIGRSPDWGSAYCLALIETPKRHDVVERDGKQRKRYDPYAKF